MNVLKARRIFRFMILLLTMVSIGYSCKKDGGTTDANVCTVSGVVTDQDTGLPLVGVAVIVKGQKDTVKTSTDGKYVIEKLTKESHVVLFSKANYLSISKTVTATSFDTNNKATANGVMVFASAKITGIVTDAKNNNLPLAGVTVSVGTAGTVVTGADGKYVLSSLLIDNYTLTFTKAAYVTATHAIVKADFVDDVATFNIPIGGAELLRGLTALDLASADKWYYNEYRGGGNADAYPHWDWACDYMCSNTFVGDWTENWEGTSLRIRNDATNQANPADLNVFDTYTYGSKKITADNKILSIRTRTFFDAKISDHNAYFGVQVIDLSAADPKAVKVGDNQIIASEDYTDFDFDLSAYVGKEVIIAIGTYRQSTGDYWRQVSIRAMRFATQKVTGTNWLPGTEVIPGWQLTKETVASTMPQQNSTFTGISPISAGRDVSMTNGYPAAYHAWRDVHHVGAEWSFVPLKKDPEVAAGEGYIIKTRNVAEVSTVVPEAYLYAKFTIAAGKNQFTFQTRNFNDTNPTYFKLTAIKEDGTVVQVEPKSNTATSASADNDGCWKFINNKGSKDVPTDYASFVYDLSQFNGSNVVLVIGVYNGVASSGENKLAFYSINLN